MSKRSKSAISVLHDVPKKAQKPALATRFYAVKISRTELIYYPYEGKRTTRT
jgi:hypothetical protein